ncbi:serum amyloid A-2 protein-like [Sorex araneus]|uniref:serum amyloid A-2 protein-like n=1 Tax=Sorex araneus TaxID=42254 RepID=UPI002433A553|nr:serum amyloid A-2 protein-like [Sorex araneus]
MQLSTAVIFCSLFLCVSSQSWFSFMRDFGEVPEAMVGPYRAHKFMQEVENENLGRLILALMNYVAEPRGPGGVSADKVTRDSERLTQEAQTLNHGDSGHGQKDSMDDQFANEWDWIDEDVNIFRH